MDQGGKVCDVMKKLPNFCGLYPDPACMIINTAH